MNVLLFNGFSFHNELFGHIIEYCQINNFNFDLFMDPNESLGWINFYESFFNIKLKILNLITETDLYQYDKILLLTDDDKKISLNLFTLFINKFVTIDHTYYTRNNLIKYHVHIGPFNNNHSLNVVLPVYDIISLQNKKKLLQNVNKIKITIISNENIYDYISLISNINDTEIHLIHRKINRDLYYPDNVIFHENINVQEMIDILCESHYVLVTCDDIHKKNLIVFSASIALAISTLNTLILPENLYNCLQLRSAVVLKKGINLYKNINLNDVNKDKQKLVALRNNIYDRFLKIL